MIAIPSARRFGLVAGAGLVAKFVERVRSTQGRKSNLVRRIAANGW